MKLYKKSQSVPRYVILMAIIILATLFFVAVMVFRSKDVMYVYLSSVFT